MAETSDGSGRAFPHANEFTEFGLTRRQYFAAAALTGVMRAETIDRIWDETEIAHLCWKVADAMLATKHE